MGRGRLRPWDIDIMQSLIAVSRGLDEADYFFTDGMILDVYNGALIESNLAVKGQRIAYLGSSSNMVGNNTKIIDLKGKVLVPGYIEPHAHPFQLYNPLTYADYVLTRGTTCSVNDDMLFMNLCSGERIIKFAEAISEHHVKMLWSARLDPQTFSLYESKPLSSEIVRRLINHPWFVQVGEITDWPALIAGNSSMQQWMLENSLMGKKAEGHAPGASERTMNPLAAAGVSACHESISAEEVLLRLRMGMYAALRHSSLRPDLPAILSGLLKCQPLAWERMMMTTDGPSPSFLIDGYNDAIIRIAIENGMPHINAYQLMSRNPAVYLGLDDEIGGLAPGRIADILVLDDLEQPTPRQVYADGKLVAERNDEDRIIQWGQQLNIDWPEMWHQSLKGAQEGITASWLQPFYEEEKTFPVIHLINAAITKCEDHELGKDIQVTGNKLCVASGSGLCYATLLTRNYRQVTHGIIKGFAMELDGMATSYTGSMDILTIGQKPEAMLMALQRVQELGGGVVVVQNGEIAAEIPLSLTGFISEEPMQEVIDKSVQIENVFTDSGYHYNDVFYTLLFLTSTHLPEIRLTKDGIVNVKKRQLLRASRPLTGN